MIAVGGTISGEHADGLSRTPFIRRQYGPLADVFREVKQIFDPQNILNPGKIVSDDPKLLTSNLRHLVGARAGQRSPERPNAAEAAAGRIRRRRKPGNSTGRATRLPRPPAIATAAAPAARN